MPASRASLGTVLDLSACCDPLSGDVPDETESAQLAAAFRALGDPVRLRLLGMLMTAARGEVCACDLTVPLGRSQPTVSHHLKVLREAGLVAATLLYGALRRSKRVLTFCLIWLATLALLVNESVLPV